MLGQPISAVACRIVAASILLAAAAAPAHSSDAQRPAAGVAAAQAEACPIPAEQARFELPLQRTTRKLAAGVAVKIVAVGSSSTYGAGASTPHASYPRQLAAFLAEDFPEHDFIVINRGVNGDTASDMVARFDAEVISEKPDLVIWQVGTNSLLSDHPLQPHVSLLQAGIARLKKSGADVVLIDPQYAPRVLEKPDAAGMIGLIERIARLETVHLFRRFALMRHWHEAEAMPFEIFLDQDGLHMNDWSYACVARALSDAIAEGVTRPVATAGGVPPRR